MPSGSAGHGCTRSRCSRRSGRTRPVAARAVAATTGSTSRASASRTGRVVGRASRPSPRATSLRMFQSASSARGSSTGSSSSSARSASPCAAMRRISTSLSSSRSRRKTPIQGGAMRMSAETICSCSWGGQSGSSVRSLVAADCARQWPSARITWNRSESDVPSIATSTATDFSPPRATSSSRASTWVAWSRSASARSSSTSAFEPDARAAARRPARRTRGRRSSAS